MASYYTVPHDAVCVVHIPLREKHRIHINFSSVGALYQALAACPFLVRCGSMSGAWQGNNKPCGPPRHECSEMVQFTFTPTRPLTSVECESKMIELIKEMKIEHTSLWQSSSSRQSTHVATRIQFNLLPRDASQVESIVKQRHMQSGICGGRVRVQAPHSPDLCRCTQCDQLGHQSNKCTMYRGFAMRLSTKNPTAYYGMTQLVAHTGARIGFIGSNIEEMRPSRRVTLLFDIDPSNVEELEKMLDRLLTVIEAQPPNFLYTEPYHLKKIQDLTRECIDVGHLDRAHACPFQQGWFNSR